MKRDALAILCVPVSMRSATKVAGPRERPVVVRHNAPTRHGGTLSHFYVICIRLDLESEAAG